jgi:hypothetical protein
MNALYTLISYIHVVLTLTFTSNNFIGISNQINTLTREEGRYSGKQLAPVGWTPNAHRLERALLITNTFFTEYR